MDSAGAKGGGRMRMALKARLEGQAWPQSLETACASGLARGLAFMGEAAAALCPVDTGELRNSLSWTVERQPSGARGWLTAGAAHAAAVELGTGRMQARPYLYPAYLSEREALVESLAHALREELGA